MPLRYQYLEKEPQRAVYTVLQNEIWSTLMAKKFCDLLNKMPTERIKHIEDQSRQLFNEKLLALREAVQEGADEIERGECSGKSIDDLIAEAKRRRT